MANKESIVGALSSFIRSENFNSKREFIETRAGLQFIACILHQQNASVRLQKKTLVLMYDLVLNDESVFEKIPNLIRKFFGTQCDVMKRLVEILKESSTNLDDPKYWDLRENLLNNLFRIF